MSASITTTISVKNQASQEIQKIQLQLQQYQKEHDSLARQIEKDNKSLAASEKELANNLDSISTQKKQAIMELQKIQRESTKEQLKKQRESIQELKATYNDENSSLFDKMVAKSKLITKDISMSKAYYDELIAIEKNKLAELKSSDNEVKQRIAKNTELKKQKEQYLQELTSAKGREEIILKEANEVLRQADLEYEAIATKRAMEIKKNRAEQRIQNEKDYNDRLTEKQRRIDLIIEEYNQEKTLKELKEKEARKTLYPRQRELAKAKFNAPDGVLKETWDTKDMKSYYAELETNSKKAQAQAEKQQIEFIKQQQQIIKSTSLLAEKEKALAEIYRLGGISQKEYREQSIAFRNEESRASQQNLKERLAKQKVLKEEKENFIREYINSSAQNKYNDTLKTLNELQARNIISTKEKEKALKNAKIALDESSASQSNLTNSVVRHLRQIETLVVAYYMLSSAWKATLGVGLEVNKIVESNTYGIAALISANTRMVDSQGNSVSSIEKFTKAQEYSKDILAKLRIESVKTYATFPQLIEIFQQATGQTLSMGNAFGGTIDEINQNTIKLASRMSNIAGAIGMPMDRVKEEIRSLMSGNASTDSLISTMIFGSPSEANKAITEAKKKANGLQDLLDLKFKPFDVLADTKSFSKSVLEVQASWQNLMGDMLEKSGAFKDITNTFYNMAESIASNSKDIIESFDSMYNSAGTVLTVAKDIGIAFAAFKILKAFPNPFTLWIAGGMAAFGIFDMLNEQIIKMQHGGKTLEEFYSEQKKIQDEFNSPEKVEARLKTSLEGLEKEKVGLEKAVDIYKKQNLETSKIEEKLKNINSEIEKVNKEYKPLFDSSEAKKQLEATKQQVELMQNLNVNQEDIKEWTKSLEESKGSIFKLEKERKELVEKLMPLEKQLAEEKKRQVPDVKSIKILEDAIKLNKDVTLATDKKITEEKEKQAKKSTQEAETESQRAIKANKALAEQQALEAELSWYKNGNLDTDKLAIDLQDVKLTALATELSYLTDKETRLKTEVELHKESYNLVKMRADEERKQYSFKNIGSSLKYTDMGNLEDIYAELTDFYQDDQKSLASLRTWYENAKKELDKMDFSVKIKFEGFDEISSGIAEIGNSFQDLNEAQLKFNDASKNREKEPLKWKQAQIDYADATMTSYANMTGALASFYDEDDERRKKQLELQKVMNAAKMAMQLVELTQSAAFTSLFIAQEGAKATAAGTTAVAVAAQSSPWTGFATAAAMAAMLASLGIMLGGKTKTSTSSDAFSSMSASEGKGSVLGDATAQSESIAKALTTLEDLAQPQYAILTSMNKYLAAIANNIGGVTSLLIQQGGFAFGEGYQGFDTGFKNNLSVNQATLGLLNPIQSIISKIPVVGQTGDLFGNIVNSVLGGLFGKTSVSQALKDSGITFADTLLTSAIKQFEGQAYQTIETTVSKKSWFSKSTSTTINSYFQNLDSETERQFSLVLNNLYNTTLEAGKALDSTTAQTEKALENFVVSIGKISLKGKTGDQIQEALTSIFGKIGDDIAKTAFPLLAPFQKVGEGMFETLTRVATGMEEAGYYIDRLGSKFQDITYTAIGNKQGNVGFEALLQSISKVENITYPTNNGLLEIVKNLELTAEELYITYTTLDELRDRLIFVNKEAQSLSSSMIQGAGGITQLQDGLSAYFENFLTEEEQLSYQTSQLVERFNNLNIALPTSKDGFKNLLKSIDTTTASGQKLYGSLIILSEEFANVSDATKKSIEVLQEELETLTTEGFGKLSDKFKVFFDSLQSMADQTRSAIVGITKKDDIFSQLVEFNKLRKEFDEVKNTTDTKKAEEIYSQILSLSGQIGGTDEYRQSIQGYLESNLGFFENQQNIIRVNIVEGLGTLEGLNKEQTNQLKEAVKDGKVTNSELNSITGLTQKQKDGIIEFANNSNYFSTEDTLYSLNEYMKKQLEVLQQTQEKETESLSSKTFTYGDYIGKQEQIDIAKLLGVSYETAKPLVEQVQALSVSKNQSADIAKIIGFTGEDFSNTTALSQLKSLSQYTSSPILSTIENLTSIGEANKNARIAKEKAEKEKADFLQKYKNAEENYALQIKEKDLSLQSFYSILYNSEDIGFDSSFNRIYENFKQGVLFSATGTYGKTMDASYIYSDRYAKYAKEFEEARSAYKTLLDLEKQKQILGYAVGATNIPHDQIAQIHKGEMIIPETFSEGIRKGNVSLSSNSFMEQSFSQMVRISDIMLQEYREMKRYMKSVAENTARITPYIQASFEVLSYIEDNTRAN